MTESHNSFTSFYNIKFFSVCHSLNLFCHSVYSLHQYETIYFSYLLIYPITSWWDEIDYSYSLKWFWFLPWLAATINVAWTTIFTTKLETRDLNTSSTPYEDTIKSSFMSHKRTEGCDWNYCQNTCAVEGNYVVLYEWFDVLHESSNNWTKNNCSNNESNF